MIKRKSKSAEFFQNMIILYFIYGKKSCLSEMAYYDFKSSVMCEFLQKMSGRYLIQRQNSSHIHSVLNSCVQTSTQSRTLGVGAFAAHRSLPQLNLTRQPSSASAAITRSDLMGDRRRRLRSRRENSTLTTTAHQRRCQRHQKY